MSGLIDSGNCLYDSLTKKPVIIVSKKMLLSFIKESELDDIIKNNSREILCETIASNDFKLPIIEIKNLSVIKNKKIQNSNCFIGIVEKKFDNSKYGCLIHRDFM